LEYTDKDHQNLVVFDPNSGQRTSLVSGKFEFRGYSPSGRFAFIVRADSDNNAIYSTIDTATDQETIFKTSHEWLEPTETIWSSDSQFIRVMVGDGLISARTDGSIQYEITGLAGFERSHIDDHWLGYITVRDKQQYAGMINLQTGEYHTFKDSY